MDYAHMDFFHKFKYSLVHIDCLGDDAGQWYLFFEMKAESGLHPAIDNSTTWIVTWFEIETGDQNLTLYDQSRLGLLIKVIINRHAHDRYKGKLTLGLKIMGLKI